MEHGEKMKDGKDHDHEAMMKAMQKAMDPKHMEQMMNMRKDK